MKRISAAMIGSVALLLCLMGADGGGCFGVATPVVDAGGAGGDMTAPSCDSAKRTSCEAATPQCWNDIFSGCVPTGTCTSGTQKQVGSFFEAPFCFSGGVKFKSRTNLANPLLNYIDYYKSDGTLCWTAESTSTTSGDNTLVYKTMAGATLGTQRTTMNGAKVTVQCDGMAELTVDSSCGGCNSGGGGGCTTGTCTVP